LNFTLNKNTNEKNKHYITNNFAMMCWTRQLKRVIHLYGEFRIFNVVFRQGKLKE